MPTGIRGELFERIYYINCWLLIFPSALSVIISAAPLAFECKGAKISVDMPDYIVLP
jgi:hypothetical protein